MDILFHVLCVVAAILSPIWLGVFVFWVVVGGMGILTCIFGPGYTELDD